MKRILIIGLILAVIILIARKPLKQTVDTYREGRTAIETVSTALDQADRAMSLVSVVQSKLEVSEKGFDDLQKQIRKDKAQISHLKAEISDLKQQQYNHVPDTFYVYQGQPETLDSALIIIDQQNEVIQHQSTQIQSLQAINLTQALIIEKQDIVIKKQDNYINQFENLRNEYRRNSARNIGIAFIAGYIAGKLF